jgi:hypothetical protein
MIGRSMNNSNFYELSKINQDNAGLGVDKKYGLFDYI